MFILENTNMLKKAVLTLGLTTALATTSAFANEAAPKKMAVDGAVPYTVKDGKYTSYHVNTQEMKDFTYGRTPTPTEIAAWNIDVMPDGTGLPKYDTKHGKPVVDENGQKVIAKGDIEWGEELYDAQCAMCHGEFGIGGKGYPPLSGGGATTETLTYQLMNPADAEPGIEPPKKVIGTFWPYASTLFWYIQDAMPFPHPKSLSNSETYAITAYLLNANEVTFKNGDDIEELSAENFMDIDMPNKDGFYPNVDTPENPQQGVENMREYLSNQANYGAGKRCMTDCIKEPVENLVMRIAQELNDFQPEASTVRDLPPVDESTLEPGQKDYENACAVCHASDAMGAPMVGSKEAWEAVLEKGIEKVYKNGINGINGMPPRGGSDYDDAKMKTVMDYMIKASGIEVEAK
jgi:cytochrome c5